MADRNRETFHSEAQKKINTFISQHPEYTQEGVNQPQLGNTNYVAFARCNQELVVFKVFCEKERKSRETFAITHWQQTGLVPKLVADVDEEMIVISHIPGRWWGREDVSGDERIKTCQSLGAAFGKLAQVPLSQSDRTYFENHFYPEHNTVEAYLGQLFELGQQIQSRDPDFKDRFWKDNLAFIETNLPTIYAQPRILFNQDPANQHIEPGRFVGFFDLEMCYTGSEAMQLGAMLNMLKNNKTWWQAVREGFETKTDKILTTEELKAIATMYYLLCWRIISRYMSYNGTPGTGFEWASPADPIEYRNKINAIEEMLLG